MVTAFPPISPLKDGVSSRNSYWGRGEGQLDKEEREEMVLPIVSIPTDTILVDYCNRDLTLSLPLFFLPPFNSTLPRTPS